MLDEKQFQKLRKNIVKALTNNDNHLLTIAHCQWLIENYWLRPQNYWSLTYDFRRYSKKDFQEFYNTFNLYEWITCEIDLNHALTWILHWIKNQQGDPNSVKLCIENFKQRCRLVQLIRNDIGLKTYNVHVLSAEYHWRRGQIYKKHVIPFYARNTTEAIQSFRARWRNSPTNIHTIKKIRLINQSAMYIINRDPRMSENLFKYLINSEVEYKDETFGWFYKPIA